MLKFESNFENFLKLDFDQYKNTMGDMELRDDLLIKDYIRGNDNALNLLIRKYESRIYGYIYSEIPNKTICNDIF
jgi:RNA polymerase sigma-70 factor (ECF subfamily)